MSFHSILRVSARHILLLCGLLAIILWLLQVSPYLNMANDAGRYMVLGESLAKTGDLRLLNDVRQPLDTLYPPGFPAIIAFWLKVTGRSPGDIVLFVKFTQLLFLLGALALIKRLLERANLSAPVRKAVLIAAALCPAFTSYANEIMSEMPFLFFCLASVVCVERDLRLPPEEDHLAPRRVALSLVCAALAFLMRTAGITLFLSLILWFGVRAWRGRRQDARRRIFDAGCVAAALGVMLLAAGGWQLRNRHIVRHARPGIRYQTYADQFSLRDPDKPNAGRIVLNAPNLLARAEERFPVYLGMIPRTLLHSMSAGTKWFVLFYILAIPLGALILLGFVAAWRRGMLLSCVFCALFWLFAAMWPWKSPRFLLPIAPLFLLYAALSVEWTAQRWRTANSRKIFAAVQSAVFALLCLYFLHVQWTAIRQERKPTAAGYTLGRTKDEGGFYAACEWLRQYAEPNAIVMGRPAYLLHIYSEHPTTQIEPHENTKVQEIQYMQKGHIAYLVQDAWPWSHSDRYLLPYLRDYGDRWLLVWQDKSGVKIWKRLN